MGGAGGARLAAHVELENAGHHDHGLRPIPVLEHREFYRFGAVHEHSAAQAGLVLDDPVAAAVLADSEQGFRTTARGRFTVVHGTSPFDASNCVGATNVQSGAYEFEREGRPCA
jgi:hypothetical protein